MPLREVARRSDVGAAAVSFAFVDAEAAAIELAEQHLGALPDDDVFVRACLDCGWITVSLDARLLSMTLACPDCERRRPALV